MSTRELSHDEAFAALDAVAFDALEAGERDAVMAHVSFCTECRAELKKLRATVAQLAFTAPMAATAGSTTARNRIRSKLMARASAEVANREILRRGPVDDLQEHRPAKPSSITDIRTWRRAEWIAMAATVLFVLTLGFLANGMSDRGNLRSVLDNEIALNQATTKAADSLKRVIAGRDSMIGSLIGRDVSVMRLTSAGAQAPFALMFWDKARNVWTFSAHNMPPLRAGRTYQLWLVTPTAKISAGTFNPTNGDAVVRATYPLSPNDLRALAVTEENSGGALQPTGQPIIAVSATQ